MEQQRGLWQKKSLCLVAAALFAAMTCVATMILVIPTHTGGYVNLGDAVVLLGGFLLGPFWGAAAGGIGGTLADLLTGYTVYAPATLLIKALMAAVSGWLWKLLEQKRLKVRLLLCGIVAETIMVIEYWLYDGFLLGSLAGAAAGIPANLMQAVFGTVVSIVLMTALHKAPYIHRLLKKLNA